MDNELVYYILNNSGKERLIKDLTKFVNPEYLDNNYIDLTIKEVENADRFLDLETGFTLTNNSIEIPKSESIDGQPHIIDLSESMFLMHEDL